VEPNNSRQPPTFEGSMEGEEERPSVHIRTWALWVIFGVIVLAILGWLSRSLWPQDVQPKKAEEPAVTEPIATDRMKLPLEHVLQQKVQELQAQEPAAPKPDPNANLSQELVLMNARVLAVLDALKNMKQQPQGQQTPAVTTPPTVNRGDDEEKRRAAEAKKQAAQELKERKKKELADEIESRQAMLSLEPTADDQKATSALALRSSQSPNTLMAGTFIPCLLRKEINSEIPGAVRLDISQTVYDTVTHQVPLIPEGAWLVGSTQSTPSYGASRMSVNVNTLAFPNGSEIKFKDKNAEVEDQSGATGLTDQIDRHYPRLVLTVFLNLFRNTTGALAGAAGGKAGQIAGGMANEVTQAGQQAAGVNLASAPTIKVRPGYPCNVFLNDDLILKPYTE
jgi:type IV secretory pathway VirB10-like protein